MLHDSASSISTPLHGMLVHYKVYFKGTQSPGAHAHWTPFHSNLHIALLHKKRARKREAHLSKPCRFDVFPSQNSACFRVILKEQLCH